MGEALTKFRDTRLPREATSVYSAGELGYDQRIRQISDIESILIQRLLLWEHCGSGSSLLRASTRTVPPYYGTDGFSSTFAKRGREGEPFRQRCIEHGTSFRDLNWMAACIPKQIAKRRSRLAAFWCPICLGSFLPKL